MAEATDTPTEVPKETSPPVKPEAAKTIAQDVSAPGTVVPKTAPGDATATEVCSGNDSALYDETGSGMPFFVQTIKDFKDLKI